MEEGKRFGVELKQTAKGSWYVGSVKVYADTTEELDRLIDTTVPFLRSKVDKMNRESFEPVIQPTAAQDILNDEDRLLFEKLRSMRMDLAKAENMPPYVIFHDSVLRKFAKMKPMTKEEMVALEGVGERSFDKYGVYFMKVIRSSYSSVENGR